MSNAGQLVEHTITVYPTQFRNYAQCTCIDPVTGQHWRSPETGGPGVTVSGT